MNDKRRHQWQEEIPGPVDASDRDTHTAKQRNLDEDPAAERGERIQTSKAMARGGKAHGHVPGATEEKK